MATNKNALIRYRTIDKCLQNRSRKWSLDDLITSCSDALYEYEGKDTHVSKRTVQLDIQMMRSNKLGYNAPIIVYQRKYYTYDDENYSITQIPITGIDMDILKESVEMLSQFKDFSLFSELNGVIQKLEDKIHRESNSLAPIIHMEKNDQLKGLHHLDTIYQAILKKIALKIHYQSFKSRKQNIITLQGYILKEYNNRWFVVGRVPGEERIMTLALDRIEKIEFDLTISYSIEDFDADNYYKDTFGVTVLNEKSLIDIILKIDRANAPYVLTKPFHHSQKLIERLENGAILISLSVHHNYEIERLILGFGNGIEVIKPRRLRSRMKTIVKKMATNYTIEL
jgi:predicted DNA-binding transcriptional regulator YafY